MRRLDEFINDLDLSILEDLYQGVGSEAYDPIAMLKLAVYACMEGNGSPAKWSRIAVDSKSIQWLIRGIRPSRTCCYNFRDRVGAVIEDFVSQAVRMAVGEGLVDPHTGIQDGSTVRAAASRHRVVNAKALQQRQEILDQAIRQDEAGIPVEDGPKWLARTPTGRQDQQQRFQQAAEVLAQRQRNNAAKRKDRRLAEGKVQVSLSEPEAPLGRDKEKVFGPLYTYQFIVEPSSLLILTYDVFLQTTDAGTLPKMMDKAQEVLGHYLDIMIADGAYASILDLAACDERGTELIAGPDRSDDKKQTEPKRPNKKPTKLDKSQFTWLPDKQTYLCPEGHQLVYLQKAKAERRDGDTLNEIRFRCPPEHCMACSRQRNCVDNPQKGRMIKRLEGMPISRK